MTTLLLFGSAFLLGCMHAFESDHLAAVSAFVANKRERKATFRFGAQWALGHAISLLTFGLALVALKATLAAETMIWFERVVGAALIVLGVRLLYGIFSAKSQFVHSHGTARGALWMGLLHGVAGTGGFIAESLVLQAHGFLAVLAVTVLFSGGVLASMLAYTHFVGRALNMPFLVNSPILFKGARALVAIAICVIGLMRI